MKSKIYLSLMLFMTLMAISNSIIAQTKLTYRDQGAKLSPSEIRYGEFDFYTGDRMFTTYLYNPAFERILFHQGVDDKSPNRKSYIATTGSIGDLSDDYHIAEGNNFQNFSVNGFGTMSLKKHGTMYGHVEYARGVDKEIGWNAVRHPDLYAPYITTDSLGGDSRYNYYSVKGGYGFNRGDWYFGVQASFKGEQAYRLTDPRLLNVTSWINTEVGVGYVTDRSMLLFSVGYERNKQYQTVRYWRPGQQDRFFVSYGFGLYDIKYSRVSFGYSRMYYIDGINSNISYEHNFDENTSLAFGMGYRFHKMKTEESDIRDLYSAITTQVNPNFELTFGDRLSWLVYGEYDYRYRKGTENIFEQYLVDEVNNVYDFRLISTRQNYSLSNSHYLLQIKPSFAISPSHSLSLVAGAYGVDRKEEYQLGGHLIHNRWIEPHLGAGYVYSGEKSHFDISVIYSRKISLRNEYNVNLFSEEVEYLDFQHAFAPYAFYANQYSGVKISASYIRDLKPLSVGLRLEGFLRNGQRNSDAVYTKDIGFESSAPLISKSADLYNEQWGKLTLFVLF